MGNEVKSNLILSSGIQFSLFVTSYLPLFLLIIVKQLSVNYKYLHWAGELTKDSLQACFLNFGLSIALSLVSVFGVIGLSLSLKNFNRFVDEGYDVKILDVRNKNNESISYIGTYIIPFLFQSYSTFYELFAIVFLLFVIYKIYVNSSLLLINPLLNIKYSIYDIEFGIGEKKKNGLVISPIKDLDEDDEIRIVKIGQKLFYSK